MIERETRRRQRVRRPRASSRATPRTSSLRFGSGCSPSGLRLSTRACYQCRARDCDKRVREAQALRVDWMASTALWDLFSTHRTQTRFKLAKQRASKAKAIAHAAGVLCAERPTSTCLSALLTTFFATI
jgi:hypothetical protein